MKPNLRIPPGSRNILILIIATIGMIPAFLTSGGYYIHGDITSQMLPYVYETKRMFASGAPFWSWNTYFGDNFIGSYAYYTVFNPFTWLNCLFPYRYLGLGFTLILYLKFLVCGYVAQKYLKKMGFGERLSLAGCLLYTFSSWAVTNLYYYMFLEPMILFPLLLIFVERFLRKERYACPGLALVTFVVVAVNYYFASVNLIAGAMYFFFRLFHMPYGRNGRIALILKAAGCVALGIACAAVVIVPVLMHLDGASSKTFYFNYRNFRGIFDRTFWLLYPKLNEGETFHLILVSGYRSNSAYVAVFGLLPAIMLFRKKGYGWIKWLTATMTIIYVTPLNGLFSLFTEGDYTRWAYALVMAFILCTLYYLKDFGLPRMKDALRYCVVVYGFYLLLTMASAFRQYTENVEEMPEWIGYFAYGAALVAINAVALPVVCSRHKALIWAVVACSSAQFLASTLYETKDSTPLRSPMTERLYFIHGDDFITDRDFCYRTNFITLYHREWYGYNFALICNRPSIETFHSIQNKNMYLWRFVVGEKAFRVLRPLKFVDSFEALMSVKDRVLAVNTPSDTCMAGSIPVETDGRFSVFESGHYIPMGFSYDRYVLTDDIEDMITDDNDADIPRILLSALSIDKEDVGELSNFLLPGIVAGDLQLDSLVEHRRSIACDSFRGHSRGFDAHIDLDSTRVVFFSVVADNGFKAYVDGKETKIYRTNLGFSSVVVPAGSHDITFRYLPPGLKTGAVISAIGLLILILLYIVQFLKIAHRNTSKS